MMKTSRGDGGWDDDQVYIVQNNGEVLGMNGLPHIMGWMIDHDKKVAMKRAKLYRVLQFTDPDLPPEETGRAYILRDEPDTPMEDTHLLRDVLPTVTEAVENGEIDEKTFKRRTWVQNLRYWFLLASFTVVSATSYLLYEHNVQVKAEELRLRELKIETQIPIGSGLPDDDELEQIMAEEEQ